MSDDLAVLIPFASTDPDRLENLAVVCQWYRDRYPGAEIVISDDGRCRAGWTKAYAVERAMAQTDASVLIVADADCLCDGVLPAVEAVRAGANLWAFPHTETHRLTASSTRAVRGGYAPTARLECDPAPYAGVPGGGIVVVHRSTWGIAPMDPRFKSTHGEDVAWARALHYLCGRPWHTIRPASSPLFHLWHPPILALGARYRANEAIAEQYRMATSRTVAAVIAQGQAHVDPPPIDRVPSDAEVAIIVPVVGRPTAAPRFMASWKVATPPARSVVYAVCDPGDRISQTAWQVAGATVLQSDRGSHFAHKANYGTEATTEPWLLYVGDDVAFHPGWLEAALTAGADVDLVSTNDMARDDLARLAVHPMIRRAYIEDQGASFDGPGLVADEGYRHWYVDREWSLLAHERATYAFAPDARIEHLHPLFGKAPMDAVYAAGQDAAVVDLRLFERRSRTFLARYRREASHHA